MKQGPEVAAELELTARVGRELVRLGLRDQATHARAYYRSVRDGRPLAGGWSHSLVVDWARALRLPPHENEYPVKGHSETCGCATPQPYTRMTFPGGVVSACGACKARWLVLE